MKESYIKEQPYTDLIKFENHVWYGVTSVLGDQFCNSGYFRTVDESTKKTYWQLVKLGKFKKQINDVLVDVDKDRGIFIVRTKDNSVKKESSSFAVSKIVETGTGAFIDVMIYSNGKQLSYINTTLLNDETEEECRRVAKKFNLSLIDLTVYKYRYEQENIRNSI